MSNKFRQAVEAGGDDPRLRKVRREFKAIYGWQPDLSTEHTLGWYTGEGAEWSVDIDGVLLCYIDRVYVIADISDTPEKLLEE